MLSPQRLLWLRPRGRVWIGALAVGLIGIVTIQLVVLRLNTSIGRSLERAATLQRENATRAIVNSEADSAEAIEAQAARLGMRAVPPGELQFMSAAGRGRAQAAAQALRSTAASSASSLSSTLGGSTATGFVTSSNGETALPTTAASQETQTGVQAGAAQAAPGG